LRVVLYHCLKGTPEPGCVGGRHRT
jgi:hypothetical protein